MQPKPPLPKSSDDCVTPCWLCGAAGRCIPVRATAGGTGVDGIEVLLITSSGGKGLVFPKVSCVVCRICHVERDRKFAQWKEK